MPSHLPTETTAAMDDFVKGKRKNAPGPVSQKVASTSAATKQSKEKKKVRKSNNKFVKEFDKAHNGAVPLGEEKTPEKASTEKPTTESKKQENTPVKTKEEVAEYIARKRQEAQIAADVDALVQDIAADAKTAATIRDSSQVGKLWIQEGLVQRRHAVRCPWFLNKTQLKTFQQSYPHVQLLPTKEQRAHPHPVLNLERAMAESDAYNYIVKMCKARDISLVTQKVVDVGGNPNRHAMNRRAVHSTNPMLSSADIVRSFSHHGAPHTCKHRAQECDCVVPAAYLSVVSLYYLSPDDVAFLVERSTAKLLVATFHEFTDAFGAFASGEGRYQLLNSDMVSMSVNGNSMAYVHSNLSWMRKNAFSYLHEGRLKTLVWTRLETYASFVTYVFTTTDVVIPVDPVIRADLAPCVQNPSYYGEVTLCSPINDQGKTSVPGDLLSLPGTKVYSWGPSVLVYQESTNVTIACPKGMVSEAANWSMGRERSSDNFKNLTAYMRNRCRVYNVPAEMIDTAVFGAVCLGFVRNVAYETSVLHGVVNPLLPVIGVHKDALALKFKTVWNWKNATIVAVAAATGVATGLSAVGLLAGPAAAIYTGAALAAAVASTGAYKGVRAAFYADEHKQTKSQLAFPEYHADRSSCPAQTRVQHLPTGINLPATDPTTSVEDAVEESRLDPSAKLKIADATTSREQPDHGPLKPGGIVSSMSIPVVPSNSAHSALVATCERILKRGPMGRGEVDEDFFAIFTKWVMENLDEMGLAKASVKAMPFSEWNCKYPAAQQKIHIEALKAIGFGDFHERLVDERGMFTKIESLTKSTEEGVTKMTPRAIQSGTPHHNVATGPWCKAFSKHLASVWSVDNVGGLMYTSGATAEQIGMAFKIVTDRLDGHLGILEGDFARFDSTIHRLFLELEAQIYRHTGCTEREYRAFLSCIATKGKDKWGNKYAVDGGRHSGDHNTSCGNSVLQGLAIIFCCAFHEYTMTGKLLSYREIVDKYKLAALLLGDDNLVMGDAQFIDTLPLKGLLLKLGLELEPKKHMGSDNKFQATFCSARFWPVEGNMVVLGPGVGRGIAKSGWYVNPPANVPIESLVRSDSIGRLNDNSFIPFLRSMWRRNHDLTQGHAAVQTAEMKRSNLHNAHASIQYQPCDETYRMLEVVYGLTKEHEEEYASLLSQVRSLPCIVDYEPLKRAMVVDGVAGDPSFVNFVEPICEQTPDVEEEKYCLAVTELKPNSPFPPCVFCGKTPCTCDRLPGYSGADDDSDIELTSLVHATQMAFG